MAVDITVVSLPMRDGNPDGSITPTLPPPLLAYL